MTERLDNIKLAIGSDERELWRIAARKLGCGPAYFRILKKSLDARKQAAIKWVYSIEFAAAETPAPPALAWRDSDKRIVVVGSGPAGLFCALRLLDRGFKPLIVERGACVEERTAAVQKFCEGSALDENCNVQFGEGGAGTFSDGKLNTQTHSGYVRDVLAAFARFGAPAEVEYLSKPHIGSDRLKKVLVGMRNYIIANGGEIRFSTLYKGLETVNGAVRGVKLADLSALSEYTENADAVVLAVGHSARDTFLSFARDGLAMESRDFAVGVRIEHLQSEIGRAQYGAAWEKLPAADYKLVSRASGRTAFTFCMCPGGVVVPAASERGGVVTNGMSDYARDGENANAALLVGVGKADFGEGLFDGVEFQRRLERAAFALTDSYAAPVQLWDDFLKGRISTRFGSVRPSYARGTTFAPLSELLPACVTEALRAAVPDMARRLRGFDTADAVLTGVETRFSSPVRVLRNERLQSVTVRDVYPCGEGCGWSGGITSSAADGLHVADSLFARFA